MTPRLALLLRRFLALALVVVPAALLALLAMKAYSASSANSDEIAAKRELLGRLETLAAQSGAIDRWAADLNASLDDGTFLEGGDPNLVIADLQARLGASVAESGATLTSFRALEPSDRDGLVDLAVDVELQGTLAGIVTALQKIEYSKPLLLVENMGVRTDDNGGGRQESEVALYVQLEIHGFQRPSGSEAPRT